MYARVAQYQVQPDKYDQFVEALNSALPLMRKQEGFQALLVLRVEGSRPPDVRVMTVWDTQLSLRQSESNLYFTRPSRAHWCSRRASPRSARKKSSSTISHAFPAPPPRPEQHLGVAASRERPCNELSSNLTGFGLAANLDASKREE